jgi:3-oxoacyl-(acyl-carrier-protein) synthase
MQRRVVITGLGVLAANGTGKKNFWQACLAGTSGIRRITRFDASILLTQIAGEIQDFDPSAFGLSEEESASLDRGTQLALAAANLALEDAHLMQTFHEPEREATGVYIGMAMASVDEGEKIWKKLTHDGTHVPTAIPDGSDSAMSAMTMAYVPSAAIAAHHLLYGPCGVISTGCSAGADAIGQAFWTIQDGRADRMLAGGADSAINYTGISVFSVMKALSTRNDEPERASRPYDAARDGFVMAEGAGILLLEEREAALARNAHIYAEIIAFASNCNAYHMAALPEDGMPLQQLLRQVLEETGITAEQVGYINAHGSSTLPNEIAETAAYKAVFGEQACKIPISATKSMIGHTQGAASAIETVVTALALKHQVLPPTINQEQPDPRCDLDYVPNVSRNATFEIALTHSSGFGGVNSVLVLAHPDWFDRQL